MIQIAALLVGVILLVITVIKVKQNKALKAKLESSIKKLDVINEQLDEKIKIYDNLNELYSKSNQECYELSKKLDNATLKLKENLGTITNCKKDINNKESAIQRRNSTISLLEKQLQESHSDLQEAIKRYNKLESKLVCVSLDEFKTNRRLKADRKEQAIKELTPYLKEVMFDNGSTIGFRIYK